MSAPASKVTDGRDVLAHLEALPVFNLAPKETLPDLAARCQIHRFKAGETVVEEGSYGDTMYAIIKGRVRVERQTLYHDHYTVSFLEAGNFFGELALLDRDRRSATCVAETDCEFLEIHRKDFITFGDRHPVAGLVITRTIASRLADRLLSANEEILSLFTALVEEVEGAVLR